MTAIIDQILNKENEQEFLNCLHLNDERLFSKLYDRYSAAVFGLILKWVNDEGAAENLLQDVFLKAFRYSHSYEPEKGRLFTWLHNIARNTCIDHMRSKAYKKCRAAVLSEDLSGLLKSGYTQSFVPDTIGLRSLVTTLRHEEKEVVEMMYFKGMTQKEIAELMNVPLGTVKTRISRGIKNLRSFFIKDWEDGTGAILMN